MENSTSWTEERVEILRRLWREGLSASRIAAELANGITRNAVIGKVHRLGLSGRIKTAATAAVLSGHLRPAQRAMTPRSPVIRGNTALALQPDIIAAPQPQPKPTADVVIPISERVTLMDLRESMCRWPLGDPMTSEFRFCGSKSPAGQGPYCVHHNRVAYQPQQDRRRDRDRRMLNMG